jgi:hypothetical protein
MYPACGWDPSCSCARDMLGSGISAEYVPIRHLLNLESVIIYEGSEKPRGPCDDQGVHRVF